MNPAPPVCDLVRLTHAEEVMGTVVSFDVRAHAGSERSVVEDLLPAACSLLHRTDAVFSTWKPQSPLSLLRRGDLTLANAPAELAEVLDLCRVAKTLSRGWFDPWAMPGGVDPTGLVKGWAAERALACLRTQGVEAALVNAGGDLVAFGHPTADDSWRVGIRHPWRPDALAAVVEVRAAVATSGTYERGEHLVDPKDPGRAARAASATVTGPSLAMADALATALALGADDVLDAIEGPGASDGLEGYEAYLVRSDGTERSTAGMAFAEAG